MVRHPEKVAFVTQTTLSVDDAAVIVAATTELTAIFGNRCVTNESVCRNHSHLRTHLAPQLPDDVRLSLEGRSLRLRLVDAGIAFDFEWHGTVFVAERYVDVPDLCIAASVHDLMLLARRQEDPDTLFFSRRLSLEGDTELGLLFKNTLDAIELPPFDLQALGPRRVLAHLRDRGAREG